MGFDNKDKEILKILLTDSRQSARQISLRLGVSTVTVLNRIKRLERDKIVKSYSAIIDHEKLGYSLTAVIEVSARKGKIVEVENDLTKFENVCGVYDITGNTDMIVIAKFIGRDELNSFVKQIAKMADVENTITHVVLNTIKEDFRLI